MFRVDSTGKAISKPTYTADGGAGHWQNGTVASSEWLEHVQEEIIGVLVAAGITPSKADDTQLLAAIQGALATMASTTDTGVISTAMRRLVAAATMSQATGLNSAVLATSDSHAVGENSAVLAALSCTAGSYQSAVIAALTCVVTGAMSAVIASSNSTVAGYTSANIAANGASVTGALSANLASDTTTAPGDQCANIASGSGSSAQALKSANLATTNCVAGAGVTSRNTANVAGSGCTTYGERVASLACSAVTVGDAGGSSLQAAMVACDGGAVGESEAFVAASNGSSIPTAANPNTVVLASNNLDASAVSAPQYSVNGGAGGQGWRLAGASGNITCTGTVTGGGLDFAELWQNATPGEIPPGVYVTLAGEDRIDVAGEGDHPLGIMSTQPTVVGNSDDLGWAGRTARDEWGRPIIVDVPHIRWSGWDGPERLAPPAEHRPAAVEAYTVTTTATNKEGVETSIYETFLRWAGYKGPTAGAPKGRPETVREWVEHVTQASPDFDPKRPHVPRVERPDEHTVAGHIGRIRLRITADAKPGDRLEPTDGGHGKPTTEHGHTKLLKILTPYTKKRGYGIGLVFFRTPDFF